jgi:cell fate regulator YaaT (PSP1 superfamily)
MKFAFVVRYGKMRHAETFQTDVEGLSKCSPCVVQTDRGAELGIIICPADESRQDGPRNFRGTVLREATEEDLDRTLKLVRDEEPQERKFCEQKVKELELAMRVADVEHLLGGEKIIFYFLADGRIDFRELVKELAKKYRTRIEMKQIGVRDEARLLGHMEHCGRELCCRIFMKTLEPVTMKMAKSQKTTLDPTKISGRCGRLMCCLRFEDKTYEDLRRKLPKKGSRVVTARGKGEVVDYDILAQLVTIETDKDKRMVIPVSEIIGKGNSSREGAGGGKG